MEKKIVSFIIVLAVLTTIAVSSIKADTFPLESSIMTDEFSTVHFNTRGNDFQ